MLPLEYILNELSKYPEREFLESFQKICLKHCVITNLPSDTFNNYSINTYPSIPETKKEIKELREQYELFSREMDYLRCFLSYLFTYIPSVINNYIPKDIYDAEQSDNCIEITGWEREKDILNKYLGIRFILQGVYG